MNRTRIVLIPLAWQYCRVVVMRKEDKFLELIFPVFLVIPGISRVHLAQVSND